MPSSHNTNNAENRGIESLNWSTFLNTNVDYGVHINTVYGLIVNAMQKSANGHLGSALSLTPLLTILFRDFLTLDPFNETSDKEDVIVFSAGHTCLALYAQLAVSGLLDSDELSSYRRLGSKAPGHPEAGLVPKVRTSTGPLGQGIANSVGMAWWKKTQKSNSKILCISTDGEMQEGISTEAISLASALKLNNLKLVCDLNNISIDGPVHETTRINYKEFFHSLKWRVFGVDFRNPRDLDELLMVTRDFYECTDGPCVLLYESTIGHPTPLSSGSRQIHSSRLGTEEYETMSKLFNFSPESFNVSDSLSNELKGKFSCRLALRQEFFNEDFEDSVKIPFTSTKQSDIRESLRERLFFELVKGRLAGGSCDLTESTGVWNFNSNEPKPENLLKFGVREHCAAAFMNGVRSISKKGFFVSTYLAFSDYLKPALRMSCLDNNGATYIFSHDDIFIGADGPTHQPVEQLEMLRSIPNLFTFRPSSVNELELYWDTIFGTEFTTALVVPRQTLSRVRETGNQIFEGVFCFHSGKDSPNRVAILSSGNDVSLCLRSRTQIEDSLDLCIDIYSIPCLEIVENGPNLQDFENLISSYGRVITVESSLGFTWRKIFRGIYSHFGVSKFGKSGTSEEIRQYFKFDTQDLLVFVKELIEGT